MSFYSKYLEYSNFDFQLFFNSLNKNQIQKILNKQRTTELDFLALLSSKAWDYIEDLAQKAHRLTINNFGKSIILYTPMYLSDYCTNQCVYCGFNKKNKIKRNQLTLDMVEKEAYAISKTGLKHILILTGDARKIATIEYLIDCVKILKKYFFSISIEIYALETDEYKTLIDSGVDSLTIYQETYNENLYKKLHLSGPKKDYKFRIDAPERGCKAGMHSVNIGALLGLDQWKREAFFTGIHGNYLLNKYPEAEISISTPRIRNFVGSSRYEPQFTVTKKNLVQFITALRIFMPRAGITISTRESSKFRNNVLKLGVTKMSAGSKTSVAGYTDKTNNSRQFDISDKRSVSEMSDYLVKSGYQPVFKDWI